MGWGSHREEAQENQTVERSSSQMGVSIEVSGHQVVCAGGWELKTHAGLKRDGPGAWAQAATIGKGLLLG